MKNAEVLTFGGANVAHPIVPLKRFTLVMRPEKGDRHPARVGFPGEDAGFMGREPVPFFLNRERSEREPLS